MRSLLLVVLLAGCSVQATEPNCPGAEWCRHLEGDAVIDSLLPLPDSLP